jgi:CheY-like chemotaxis protein
MARPSHILVVDDEGEIVRLIEEVLRDEGYTVRSAHDGPSALRSVADAMPALVLLDFWMPGGMTGADVLKQLRGFGHDDLPVILMSAGTRGEIAQHSGANAFLAKPFDISVLLSCIEQFIMPQQTRPVGDA